MVAPDKAQIEAEIKEEENYKFRTFLKVHADEEELDKQFYSLHKELFADYDCSKCRIVVSCTREPFLVRT